jgi:hypothetical protein
MKEKTFDTVASRSRITKAQDEAARIRRRIDRLDGLLVGELNTRIRDLDAAVIHVGEIVRVLNDTRAMRGRG